MLAPLGPPAVKRESSLTGTGAMIARVQASEFIARPQRIDMDGIN